jgi:hypothetical protein
MTLLSKLSFTSGELTPALASRVDLEKYGVGAKTMKNFFPHVHGGASNRAGTYYIGEVKTSASIHKQIKFQFSTSQSYGLVFGNLTLQITKNGAFLLDGASRVEVVTPYASADLSELKVTQSADVMYIVHPDYAPRKLSRTSDTSWTLEEVDFTDGPYRDRTASDVDIAVSLPHRGYSPSTTAVTATSGIFSADDVGLPFRVGFVDPADLSSITWTWGVISSYSSATVVFVTFESPPGHEYCFNPDFEYALSGWDDESLNGVGLTYDAGDKTVNLLHNATGMAIIRQTITGLQKATMSLQVEVDALTASAALRVRVGTTSGGYDRLMDTITTTGTHTFTVTPQEDTLYISIDTGGSTNDHHVDISAIRFGFLALDTIEWRLPAWTDSRGYPRSAGFFEQRLCLGGSIEEPLTVWESVTGDFENFTRNTPAQDDDAFSYMLASGEVNPIYWMVPLSALIIGTSGSEFRVSSGSDAPVTPTSVSAKPQSYDGSADIPPLVIGSQVLFVQDGGNVVKELKYSLERDGYASKDITIMSSHLLKGRSIVSWAYARKPDSIIYCVLDNGDLLGLTYMPEHEIWGWHQHETDGEFEDVCVLPVSGGNDAVYFIVKRTIDGSEVRYIEKLMPRINDADTYDYFFLDCGITYSGAATTTITGLDHLEGETVTALANGSVVSGLTVSSGSVTLPVASTLVHVGLPYVSDLETLRIETQDNLGTSQGRTKSIPSVTIQVEDTRGLWAGPDEDHLDELKIRELSDGEDPIALRTGNKKMTLDSGYDLDGRVFIRQTDPVPVTVLAIIPDVEIGER